MFFVNVTGGAGNPAAGTSSTPTIHMTDRLRMSRSFQSRYDDRKWVGNPYAMRMPGARPESTVESAFFPRGTGEISRIGWEFFRADRRRLHRWHRNPRPSGSNVHTHVVSRVRSRSWRVPP